jgi:hypothetical protein
MRMRTSLSAAALVAVSAFVAAFSTVSCSSQDPGAFEIVPRKTPTPLPTTSASTNPTGDGGSSDGGTTVDGGGDAAPTSPVFTAAYTAMTGPTDPLATVHNNNGGPATTAAAKTSDCLGCHASNTKKFIAAGVASKPDIEIGIKLANGKFFSARSAKPDMYFSIDLPAGETINGAKVAARDGTKEKVMSSPLAAGGCNTGGGCHGGTQGDIFK